jgi:hypothetical protein
MELLTVKLEKVYQLLREERRTGSELMIRYQTNVPQRTESAADLRGPSEDFRRFQEGSADLEVFINLFFPEFLSSFQQCEVWRHRFVMNWYNIYNLGVDQHRALELMNAMAQFSASNDLLERDIKLKARELSKQQTGAGLVRAFGDLLKDVSEGTSTTGSANREWRTGA